MLTVLEGTLVTVRTADDRLVSRRAVSGVVDGDDFPVVWVCSVEEWTAAQTEKRAPLCLSWPATDVLPYQKEHVAT